MSDSQTSDMSTTQSLPEYMSMLDFERQIFLDVSENDGLLITGKYVCSLDVVMEISILNNFYVVNAGA